MDKDAVRFVKNLTFIQFFNTQATLFTSIPIHKKDQEVGVTWYFERRHVSSSTKVNFAISNAGNGTTIFQTAKWWILVRLIHQRDENFSRNFSVGIWCVFGTFLPGWYLKRTEKFPAARVHTKSVMILRQQQKFWTMQVTQGLMWCNCGITPNLNSWRSRERGNISDYYTAN